MNRLLAAALKPANRGSLLDVLVFLANLGLTPWLAGYVLGVIDNADRDRGAALGLGMLALGALVLPAAGAVLKRWHTHRRLGTQAAGLLSRTGCLFSPLFYFPLTLVVTSAVLAGLSNSLLPGIADHGGLFTTLAVLGVAVSAVQTALVYSYFSPPRQAPRSAFLRSGASDFLGDVCLNLNMVLYQVLWGMLSSTPFSPLAEDLQRPQAWATLLLANLSTIVRVLFGAR